MSDRSDHPTDPGPLVPGLVLNERDWSVNHLAAQAVALYGGGTPAERRELLELLGLLDDSGQIAPDDKRIYELTDVNNSTSVDRSQIKVREPNLDRSLVPPGLANLPPLPVQPKVRKLTALDPGRCGSLTGRSAHLRRQEPLCEECREFYNAHQREKRRQRRLLAQESGEEKRSA